VKKKRRFFRIAFLSLLLSGCMTFEAAINDPQPLDLPAGTDPIPAAVGVYYSPAFLTYAHDESLLGQHTMHFEMGEPSADHFDEVFLALFENVQILNNLPVDLDNYTSLDAVIEPSFEQMTVEDPIWNMPGEAYVVTLAFNFRLLAPEGDPHASWNIRGRGESELHWGDTAWNSAGDAARLALEDVSQQLFTGFHAVPGVDQWLASLDRQ
jgi:hypothetical protein